VMRFTLTLPMTGAKFKGNNSGRASDEYHT
jgi:hypothetical protein